METKLSPEAIAQIDKELDAEFETPIEDEENDDLENEEEETEEEDDLEEDGDDDFEDEVEEEEEEKEPAKKPTKGDKQEHAFKQLREEKAAAERVAAMEREEKLAAKKVAETEQEFMKKLAKTSGYDDVAEYRKALEDRLIQEEAKQHGVTPEVYKELANAKAKIESYEKEKVSTERAAKSKQFLETINTVLSEYDVDPKVLSKELFASLQSAGYTIETLISIPQPEFIIKGALYERLSKAAIKDSQIRGGVETKKIKGSSSSIKTVDELVEEEMVAYAKSRGLKYSK